jgi:hypothetical protein
MSKLERKLYRQNTKKTEKKAVKKATKEFKKMLTGRIDLFNKIPNRCMTCEKPFDRTSREDTASFRVVVREEEEVINLYCPDCWNKAIKIVEEFSKKKEVNP